MKLRNLRLKKLNNFHNDISEKGDTAQIMSLQMDQEFQQNEIKKLNKKFNLKMFSMLPRGGKSFGAKPKICKFKKLLSKSKTVQKQIDAKKLIQKATDNLNSVMSAQYGYPPEKIEVKSLKNDQFRDIYDFYRLIKVKQNSDKVERMELKKDRFNKRKLRVSLVLGEKVLVLARRVKRRCT